jgi:hypothetical protein
VSLKLEEAAMNIFIHFLLAAMLALPISGIGGERANTFLNGEPSWFVVHALKHRPLTLTLKLVATPLKSGPGAPIAQVNGLLHGVDGQGDGEAFFAKLMGTASLTPVKGRGGASPKLQIGLYEIDFGLDEEKSSTGLWSGYYSLVLEPEDLSGNIMGQYNFTPIKESGEDLGPSTKKVIAETITPVVCDFF